jgi:hypothetical protein
MTDYGLLMGRNTGTAIRHVYEPFAFGGELEKVTIEVVEARR